MKTIFRTRRHSTQAAQRLERMRAFTECIERLTAYKGGLAFAVDTTPLQQDPPALHVTERHASNKLHNAQYIGALVMYAKRTLVITQINKQLTYIIY